MELLAQKITSLQRCAARARQARERSGDRFREDHDSQDVAVLNTLRACESTLDIANMLIRRRRLGIPSESRDSFTILVREGIIDADLGQRLKKMVGFRNLAVHQYQELDLNIVESVIDKELDQLLVFADVVRRAWQAPAKPSG